MSDYIYTLESHLNALQNRIVSEVQDAAKTANQNVYLAGGAMRDLLDGSPTRDLDFVIEGPSAEIANGIAEKLNATVVSRDHHRQVYELSFPGAITAQIAMSRQEKFEKPGAKPQVTQAGIHDDLRRRDFTINAIALKLNRGAMGLLIDPTNGIADLQSREIRSTYPSSLYDDPSRLLRAIRLKHRLQFTLEERTARQFENAISEELQLLIPPALLLDELKRLGDERNPADTVKELEACGLLKLYSSALAEGKWNYAAVAKLEKLKKSLPLASHGWTDGWRSFFVVLTTDLSPKERADLASRIGLSEDALESCRRLQAHARKLEAALKSTNLRKPSQIYEVANAAEPDELLFVLHESMQRIVQDRLRHYIQKYLPLVQEIPQDELDAAGISPDMPKFEKLRAAFVAARLNARPKKPDETSLEMPPPLSPAPRGRPARGA